jgi:hypothetical protein
MALPGVKTVIVDRYVCGTVVPITKARTFPCGERFGGTEYCSLPEGHSGSHEAAIRLRDRDKVLEIVEWEWIDGTS